MFVDSLKLLSLPLLFFLFGGLMFGSSFCDICCSCDTGTAQLRRVANALWFQQRRSRFFLPVVWGIF